LAVVVTVASAAIPWDLRRRGLKDSIRHDQRIKDALKQNLKDLIAEETIITSDGRKLVKNQGYCTVCANELLKYVSSLLAREK